MHIKGVLQAQVTASRITHFQMLWEEAFENMWLYPFSGLQTPPEFTRLLRAVRDVSIVTSEYKSKLIIVTEYRGIDPSYIRLIY